MPKPAALHETFACHARIIKQASQLPVQPAEELGEAHSLLTLPWCTAVGLAVAAAATAAGVTGTAGVSAPAAEVPVEEDEAAQAAYTPAPEAAAAVTSTQHQQQTPTEEAAVHLAAAAADGMAVAEAEEAPTAAAAAAVASVEHRPQVPTEEAVVHVAAVAADAAAVAGTAQMQSAGAAAVASAHWQQQGPAAEATGHLASLLLVPAMPQAAFTQMVDAPFVLQAEQGEQQAAFAEAAAIVSVAPLTLTTAQRECSAPPADTATMNGPAASAAGHAAAEPEAALPQTADAPAVLRVKQDQQQALDAEASGIVSVAPVTLTSAQRECSAPPADTATMSGPAAPAPAHLPAQAEAALLQTIDAAAVLHVKQEQQQMQAAGTTDIIHLASPSTTHAECFVPQEQLLETAAVSLGQAVDASTATTATTATTGSSSSSSTASSSSSSSSSSGSSSSSSTASSGRSSGSSSTTSSSSSTASPAARASGSAATAAAVCPGEANTSAQQPSAASQEGLLETAGRLACALEDIAGHSNGLRSLLDGSYSSTHSPGGWCLGHCKCSAYGLN